MLEAPQTNTFMKFKLRQNLGILNRVTKEEYQEIVEECKGEDLMEDLEQEHDIKFEYWYRR